MIFSRQVIAGTQWKNTLWNRGGLCTKPSATAPTCYGFFKFSSKVFTLYPKLSAIRLSLRQQ